MRSRAAMHLVPVAALAVATGASAQPTDNSGSGFSVTASPYIWLPTLSSHFTAGALSGIAHRDLTEVAKKSDPGFQPGGRIELRIGRFGAFADGSYLHMQADDVTLTSGASATTTFEGGVVDFGVLFRLANWDMTESRPTGVAPGSPGALDQHLSWDLYGGGRYTNMEIRITPAGASSVSSLDNWTDPIVGTQLSWDITPTIQLTGRGDVGGFGASSDFVWSATATLAYRFHIGNLGASLFAGYKALREDRTDNSRAFSFRTTLHGPIAGFGVTF